LKLDALIADFLLPDELLLLHLDYLLLLHNLLTVVVVQPLQLLGLLGCLLHHVSLPLPQPLQPLLVALFKVLPILLHLDLVLLCLLYPDVLRLELPEFRQIRLKLSLQSRLEVPLVPEHPLLQILVGLDELLLDLTAEGVIHLRKPLLEALNSIAGVGLS
jgi:hypothetical protein